MTEWITRTFIKEYDNTTNPRVRAAYGKISSMVGIICNLFLFAGKLIAGIISGSVSITADAVNNLSDASSSIISLFGFKLSMRPADEEHPYGHARFEYLSGLMVALLIMIIGVELLKSSIQKIIHPTDVTYGILALVILFTSIAVKFWMSFFFKGMGKKINSNTLLATAADSRNDVITTASVLLAAVISKLTSINLDGWMGLIVGLFILYSGFGIVKDTINPLLGQAPDPELISHINKKVVTYDKVLGTHDLIVHDYGAGRLFASIHVEMPAEENPLVCHDIIDNIEKDFLAKDNINVVVHYDPIVTKDKRVGEIRAYISGIVSEIDGSLTIHDLRIVPGKTHTNIIFDCVVPFECKVSKSEIKDIICKKVTEKNKDYFCVIKFEASYAGIPKHSEERNK